MDPTARMLDVFVNKRATQSNQPAMDAMPLMPLNFAAKAPVFPEPTKPLTRRLTIVLALLQQAATTAPLLFADDWCAQLTSLMLECAALNPGPLSTVSSLAKQLLPYWLALLEGTGRAYGSVRAPASGEPSLSKDSCLLQRVAHTIVDVSARLGPVDAERQRTPFMIHWCAHMCDIQAASSTAGHQDFITECALQKLHALWEQLTPTFSLPARPKSPLAAAAAVAAAAAASPEPQRPPRLLPIPDDLFAAMAAGDSCLGAWPASAAAYTPSYVAPSLSSCMTDGSTSASGRASDDDGCDDYVEVLNSSGAVDFVYVG